MIRVYPAQIDCELTIIAVFDNGLGKHFKDIGPVNQMVFQKVTTAFYLPTNPELLYNPAYTPLFPLMSTIY
jgi:hypothetical protein